MGRILVADDEPHILEVMMDVLESVGHEVVGVPDGEAAIQQIQLKRFDVVILDVKMPKLDGYHAAQQIQGLSPRPRIIIVTARNFESDRHALKGAGVDAFLPKPFANKDLILAVASLMKKKHA